MPAFADPFAGMTPERKLTLAELTRALRLDLAAEEEAVHLYAAQADATDHELAARVLRDIADEERVHAGELQRLLSLLLADEDGFLAEGAAEVDALAATVAAEEATPEAAETAPADIPTLGSLR
jgi:uncharacterized protein